MAYCYPYPHPAVTTDVVVFTILDETLKLLLVRRRSDPFKGQWALPGGFVRHQEGLMECATRKLEDETGIKGVYLEQLYTFGQPERDPRERVICVAYYALVCSDRLHLGDKPNAEEVGWHTLEALPPLAFDHRDVVSMAHERLAAKLEYSTIALQFMPKDFTFSELQAVHEIILREAIDKRNFRKRILAMGQIVETGAERRNGAHRPAKLYRVKDPSKVQIIK